ncbi:fused MFS/spermidine synthase [Thalassomonas viridans]|uniref:Fused MFS/spermidine synthase n=1 Tax=Thalassomonas viridans TaxID=137584 RepID=A0AAF0C9T7_9GAMM|nr:fused MFS/spermidine synthase [Thalassomonas viridans]WDE05791.1 fused MFS/spermidine synthase [Thalassomonas viridans]
MFKSVLPALLLLLGAGTPWPGKAEIVHSERSLYRNIMVEDKGDLRCLRFNVKQKKSNQSCLYKSQPQQLVFNYTKLLFSGLILNSQPERILIVGLGGGTMSNTLHQLYPDARIDNVEIDPAVIKVAREYFGFFENERVTAIDQDGRLFIKRALMKKQQYDWIILDAFNGEYIPEHLLTREFLQEAKQLLSDNGVLTSNTFSNSGLYAYESATYYDVFGDYFNVRNSVNENRIILTAKQPLPDMKILSRRLDDLDKRLKPYGVNIKVIFALMTQASQEKDWPEDTRVLTDQYSPANLLNID